MAFINVGYGNIVKENHMIVLSSLLPDTITNRLNNSYVTS